MHMKGLEYCLACVKGSFGDNCEKMVCVLAVKRMVIVTVSLVKN